MIIILCAQRRLLLYNMPTFVFGCCLFHLYRCAQNVHLMLINHKFTQTHRHFMLFRLFSFFCSALDFSLTYTLTLTHKHTYTERTEQTKRKCIMEEHHYNEFLFECAGLNRMLFHIKYFEKMKCFKLKNENLIWFRFSDSLAFAPFYSFFFFFIFFDFFVPFVSILPALCAILFQHCHLHFLHKGGHVICNAFMHNQLDFNSNIQFVNIFHFILKIENHGIVAFIRF